MRKVILFIVFVVIIAAVLLFVRNGGIKQEAKNNEIVTVFDIPSKAEQACFPIEIADYKDTITSKGELMIFGRTVWHEDADTELGGKPAIVPVKIYQKNAEGGDDMLVAETVSNSMDGHFVVVLKDTEKKYYIKIDLANAEDCPEKYKINF